MDTKINTKKEIKLFTIGPVEMYPSTKIVRNNGFVHFRTNEYSEIVKNNLHKLGKLLGTNQENALIYLASSGTGAMEATVENCVSDTDKVLVIDGGSFGHRFCELLKYHNKQYESIKLDWNEQLTNKHLEKYDNKDFTMLFVNIHETSSGQLYDIHLLSEFCKKNNMFLVVDAISSFLADEYKMDEWGIDLTIISSQKGLCLSPGMSLIAFSQRMIDKVNRNNKTASCYFDFKDYLINITRGQTPYTPPVCIMYELQDMLELIEKEGGITARLNTIKEKCEYFREKAKLLGFTIPNYKKSNMLTPILLENVNAYDVIQLLKDKYRIFVNPCGGELATKLLRVSHIGNTTISDIDYLLEKLQNAIKEIEEEEYDRK